MDLIVGATGLLGMEICRLLRQAGHQVRGLVRKSSEPNKLAALEQLGVQLSYGDLKDTASLRAACSGVHSVITTASATLSRSEGDDLESVDGRGSLALIEAAAAEGISHFIYTSFAPIESDFPLQRKKREVEAALEQGRLPWTILQPTHFFEVWFSPALGLDVAAGKARVLGTGERPLHWVSFRDVARVAVAVVKAGPQRKRLSFGGPKALSQDQVIGLFEAALGVKLEREQIPEASLLAQLQANDALERSFAGLMLCCSTGEPQRLDNGSLRGIYDAPLTAAEQLVRAALG